MNWVQLEIEFTWADLTEEELKHFLTTKCTFYNHYDYIAVDLTTAKPIVAGDFMTCLKYIKDASKFYRKYPYYVMRTGGKRYELQYFQLVGVP